MGVPSGLASSYALQGACARDGAFADLYKPALEASENDPNNRIGVDLS